MALKLLDKVKLALSNSINDDKGSFRQGKFTPVKNLRDMAADSEGWFQQGKFTPGRQISSQINYQKQNSPINRALYTGLETASRPVVNSLANIGALGATGLGSLQMAFNKPQAAQKSFDKALAARQFAGTQGSFDQGTGWNTIKKGGIDAIQTALTGKGLKYTTPVNLGISGLLGGTMSKLSGGDFATGFGQGMGVTPQVMGFVGLTNPILSKALGGTKLAPLMASKAGSRITPAIANVAQGIGMDLARGTPTTAGSIGLDLLTGGLGGKTQFDMPSVKGFAMDKAKLDQIIQAEDMLKNPKNYVKDIYHATKKNKNLYIKQQSKEIQNKAAEVIDRLAAQYLPNKILSQTSGDSFKQIKALIDLNAQNGLTNVQMGIKSQSQPIKTGGEGTKHFADIDTVIRAYKQSPNGFDLEAVRKEYKNFPEAIKKLDKAQAEVKIEKAQKAVIAKREAEYGNKLNALANNTRIMGDDGQLNINSIKDFQKAEYELAKQYPDISGNKSKIEYYEKTHNLTTKQPTIKIKPSEKIKISALESKPSKPQLSEQSQTLVKQNLDQPRTSLNTQTDQMKNSVPSSVVEGTPSKVSQPIIPQKKYLESVNTTKLKLKPEEKKTLETATNLVKDEIQKVKGKTLSNDEVIKVAKESDILQKVITRDQTLEAEAIQLKARQQMVSLDKEVNELSKQGNSPLLQKKIQELLESIKTVNANAADKGRQLQALSIDAGDESVRLSILKDISKIETDTEKIIRESANVDWGNANKVAEFYRKFIKPSTMETLDEFRYNNMLSSPRTHIRNAFSNLVQTFVTRPATLAAQGKLKQTGQYYVGAIKSLPDAVSEFAKSFKGETPIGQQDIKNIPTGKIPKFMTIPSKALEASDRFFTKLISSGEMARGASEKEALDTAAYSLFRQGLNPEGQGKLLNAIDSLTSWTYNAPKAVRWFVPFIRTPMNFAKQWVEYSPSGFLTTIGAKNKGEQIAKAFVGSTIMAVGAKFALDNNTTWSAPTDPKEKEIFYASGRKPFSVKIGDKWVSMMYAGPFALAFAVPAAAKYYQEDNRTALTDTQLQKLGKVAMSMAEYLSGQTFLEGMNNFVKFFSGDADYTFAKNMGYTAGQVIPLQGLVRWVSGIIDPVYRKATTFGDQIKSGIPGVSKTLPPYLDPTGEPSTREGYNSFTPYDITPNKSEYNKPLEERQDKLQQNAVINKTVKEMESQLQSGTDPKPVQVGNIFILPEDGEIKKIELKQFSLPKKTGDVEKDKKAFSSYKSSITAQIKQVDRLIAAGAMPADQGNELKANLNDLKNQASTVSVSSGGKKSTKSKGGKITIKTGTTKFTPIKIKTYKPPTLKISKGIKKPSISNLKSRRTIKIKV